MEINSGAINQWLFNQDTVDKILLKFMEVGQKVEGNEKIGKTIIFARSHKHAEFIYERFKALYPQYKTFPILQRSSLTTILMQKEQF